MITTHSVPVIYVSRICSIVQEENFHWSLHLAILLMAKSVNLNPAYYYIFRNLLIIAKLNSVYFFIPKGIQNHVGI